MSQPHTPYEKEQPAQHSESALPALASLNANEAVPTNLADRSSALDAFGKLEMAFRLIQAALAERPNLKVLQFEPMLRELAEGMKMLSFKDTELDLHGLCLKHEWFVGQRFYVRAKVEDVSQPAFVVLAAQDVPEGVSIVGRKTRPNLAAGQTVGLDLEIKRKHAKPAWHIRAIDLE